MSFKIVIRVDASLDIGTGHVMRTLTLAQELRKKGAQVSFICRELSSHLCDFIEAQDFLLHRLPRPKGILSRDSTLTHAHWLGVDWQLDAEQTATALKEVSQKPDWLVVDHYALDKNWESYLRSSVKKIMVIDDLADRFHDCDLLLDQNLYDKSEERYTQLVSSGCNKLLGPLYALLREEFKTAREKVRDRDGSIQRIFVFFGGIDPSRETEKTLRAFALLRDKGIEMDVVVGASNLHQEEIKKLCKDLPRCHFHSQVNNIAELMMNADLALGAAGTTTWERLCLGLPSVVISVAENQEKMAEYVAKKGGHIYLGKSSEVSDHHLAEQIKILLGDKEGMREMSLRALQIVDGLGVERVFQKMKELS